MPLNSFMKIFRTQWIAAVLPAALTLSGCISATAPILTDAQARGYKGALSLEPHMVVVFHDAQSKTSNEDAMRKNFVEYGHRLEQLVGEVKQPVGSRS
jgi:hypothetical protein